MRDILSILQRWTSEGHAVALGSVIERIGSAPRDPGATIAVAVYPLDPALLDPLADAVGSDLAVALTVRLSEQRFGELRLVSGDGGTGGDAVETAARSLLELGESGVVETGGGEPIFVES